MSDRPPPDEDDDARFTKSLAGLAVALLLVVFGYWLMEHLAAESKLEDCMMAGRPNCVPVDKSSLGN